MKAFFIHPFFQTAILLFTGYLLVLLVIVSIYR